MSEVALIEQLDQAIDAMLANPKLALSSVDGGVAELVGIAAELRLVPRESFKTRLKNELEGETAMSTAASAATESSEATTSRVNPIPEGFRTLTPYLVVSDVHAEIEFLKNVFGAEGKVNGLGSQGGFHAEYRVGDSMLMIGGGGEGSAWQGTPIPASLHLYVEDVHPVYERSVPAG